MIVLAERGFPSDVSVGVEEKNEEEEKRKKQFYTS